MLQDNYLGRQIDSAARMLSFLLLKRDMNTYYSPADLVVHAEALLPGAAAFLSRLDALSVGDAEDALFDALEAGDDLSAVQAAIVFYMKLNGMKDNALQESGFTREEILDGLNEIKAIFGVETL